jgi:hypothetical protein
MKVKIIMFLLHMLYKERNECLVYIKGTGNEYPRYLIYTEDESFRKYLINCYEDKKFNRKEFLKMMELMIFV